MNKDLTNNLKNNYWDGKDNYTPQEAMGLIKNQFNENNIEEFQIYGNRLADKIISMYHLYSKKNIKVSNVLEIGCGMGRYALPFSKQCNFFYGIDISEKMVDECKKYLNTHKIENYEIIHNNGYDINIKDNLDFIYSTGVFQHIVNFDVIIEYIKKSIKLLNDDGIFIFQFMGWYNNSIGKGTMGAKITAKKLNDKLMDDENLDYKINEINIDINDPKKQIFIILQKTKINVNQKNFENIKMINKNFRTGTFNDLNSYKNIVKLWKINKKKELHKLTFYD